MPASRNPSADRALADSVAAWFREHARPFPWRGAGRCGYGALVSEAMLQQTQAARAAERYASFIARYPTVEALAGAGEADVLALWSGLGYYRRARNLHGAARRVVEQHGGVVPADPGALRALPGVGPYTAGAIASIVFGAREPIVDANVARVLLRLAGRRADPADPGVRGWLWERARTLVAGASDPSAFNEGLMELGAVVCQARPRRARCEACPVAAQCGARAAGIQDTIPLRPRVRAAKPRLGCAGVVALDPHERVLLQRRPARGLWAGLWQAPTLERPGRPPDAATVRRWVRAELGFQLAAARAIGTLAVQTSHRDVRIRVWRADVPRDQPIPDGMRWADRAGLEGLPLGSAQRRVLELALGHTGATARRVSVPGSPRARRAPRRSR